MGHGSLAEFELLVMLAAMRIRPDRAYTSIPLACGFSEVASSGCGMGPRVLLQSS